MTQVLIGSRDGGRQRLPMQGRRNIVRQGLQAGLIGTALWIVTPTEAAAQSSCWNGGTAASPVYTCWLDSGGYTSAQSISETLENAPSYAIVDGYYAAVPMVVTSYADIGFTASPSQNTALSVYVEGGYIYGFTSGLSVTNTGALTLTGTRGDPVASSIYGLTAGLYPDGSGDAPNTYNNLTGQSLPQELTITNSGAINILLGGVTIQGGAAILATAIGGEAGGYTPGNSGGVIINNSGEIAATMNANGYSGIMAYSKGGDSGVSDDGGYSEDSTVNNSGSIAVDVAWANWVNSATNSGVYGIVAQSVGGAGGAGANDYNGASGGRALSAAVNLTRGGNVRVATYGTAPTSSDFISPSAGVSAAVIGGDGGQGYNEEYIDGGEGGHVGIAQISVTDANVEVTGDNLPALLALAQGGTGGDGGDADCSLGCQSFTNGGDGNDAGEGQDYAALVQVTADKRSVKISADGTNSAAVAAQGLGGDGGNGGYANALGDTTGGNGGDGGDIDAPVAIQLMGTVQTPISLRTKDKASPGILAQSTGGAGGYGGGAQRDAHYTYAGNGGAGGAGGDVNVSLYSTAVVATGRSSSGIVAISEGGFGGYGGQAESGLGNAHAGNGGAGGNSGNVTVGLDQYSSISTQGNGGASGIVAQSFSGGGGSAYWAGGVVSSGGNGGAGGNAGNVTVTNNGTITTQGGRARGIVAQSMSGNGGSGSSTGTGFFARAGSGGSSGTVGAVTVQHNGSITTAGTNAQGILAQSIGGAGGAGGQASGVFGAIGGNKKNSPHVAHGGAVTINTNSGSITTSGTSATGILGQSIGGGGGDGGGAQGVFASIGGNGGPGGNGGTVYSTSNYNTTVTTTGDVAAAVILQSIGGGGGNGGNASSGAPFVSAAIGGNSGGGGDGGSAVFNGQNQKFITGGNKSPGLVVQSIGGGGGTGGNAFSGSVGPGFAASVAIGGRGGAGGDGGAAQVQLTGGIIATGQNPLLSGQPGFDPVGCTKLPCNTLPGDNYGVLVQSIGGGGGLGGSAVAESIAIAVGGDNVQAAVVTSSSVGGAGGAGGDGGAVQFALSEGSQILTSGQGSTAVLAQSIGGGGGVGGDSSSSALAVGLPAAPEAPTSLSLATAFSVGGNGGGGGTADDVHIALSGLLSNCASGSCTITPDGYGNPTSITTYGDFANGAVAQSIGGGGGNAGFGSASTQSYSTGYNMSIAVTLGSTGGDGGDAGEARIDQFAGNRVTTFGSGSVGLMAQSIGGGGGASQGGSVTAGVGFSVGKTNFAPGVTVNVGTKGGSGGDAGDVTVSAQGAITTFGGDATGILAQSIGGGGGLGGSAGADASADNPVLQGLDARQEIDGNLQAFYEAITKGQAPGFSLASDLEVSVGGTGGHGNDGGSVWAGLYAPIVTFGDWANGIVAQSIGGGGGKGGVAAASGTGGFSYITINHDIAVGGSGGAGGEGGSVTVELNQGNQGGSSNNNTGIRTAGYGATALLAQSIGGGGGAGAHGSDSGTGVLSVGGQEGGGGGGGGSGGAVNLSYYNPNSTVISTAGDAADGVVLQSIGGGGGTAGGGSRLFLAAHWQSTSSLKLSAGQAAGTSGNGGAVTFAPTSDDPYTPITIATTGNDSFGILAQSIGGGGGMVTSQQTSSAAPILSMGSSGGKTTHGGAVDVTLASKGLVATTGIGAHGIVAQSIGGGGGIVRLVNLTGDSPTLNTTVPVDLSPGNSLGNGGKVTVKVDGDVSVAGAGAVGILAQSVGSGGGIVMNGDTFFAGSPNFSSAGSSGHGSNVFVKADGTVSATGANGIGIFAQSTGYSNASNGQVNVSVGGTVTGGSGQAAQSDSSGNSTQLGSSAVQVDSPNGSNNGTPNVVTVHTGAALNTVSSTNGTAFVQTGGGTTNLTSYGTITGSTYLGKDGNFTNSVGGVHNSGSDVMGHVVNHSVVNIGLPSEVRATRVSGDFTQTAPGRLGVTIDSLVNAADYLHVAGSATLDGVIAPTAISLLPGTVEVAEGKTLVSTADALDSLVFRWDASQSGNRLSITPTANFLPGGVSLNDSQSSLASYFGRAWDSADRNFAKRFAGVSNINDGDTYRAALNAFSSKTALAQSIALANSAGTILGAGMSCPVFGVDTVLLGEDDCAWAQVSGSWTNQSATGDTLGYDVNTTTYRIGAQHEIAQDWYLGASFGYGHNQADMDGGSSGDGDIFDGSVTLKRVMGPWQFAGSLAIAGGSFDTNRRINIPGVANDMLTSDSSMFMAGGRLRAAYEFAFEDWYIRPYGDLDLIYTNMRGFQENGGIYALDVGGSTKTNVALSPMVEFGGRLNLEGDATLRAYAAFGLSYRPDNERTVESSFVGASPANGTFTDYIESPELLGRIDVGMQLFVAGGYELKGEYTADIGDSFVSQSATARFAYRF